MQFVQVRLVCICMVYIFGISLFLNGFVYAEEDFLLSNESWKVSLPQSQGWIENYYDDTYWETASIQTRVGCSPAEALLHGNIWGIASPDVRRNFRKNIYLTRKISHATLELKASYFAHLYINGEFVDNYSIPHGFTDVETIDITKFLRYGKNTIAVYSFDTETLCPYISVRMQIGYVKTLESTNLLSVDPLKQTDPQWANQKYDSSESQNLFCGNTLSDCGCLITSATMLLNYYGVPHISPDTLNSYLLQDAVCGTQGCYSKGYIWGDVRWTAIGLFSLDQHKKFGTQKIQFVSLEDFSQAKFEEEIKKGNPVVLKSPFKSHWFVGYGFDTEDIYIHDPFYNYKTLSEGYDSTASRMAYFERVNSDYSGIEIYVKEPYHVLVTDSEGRKTGFDPRKQSMVTEIPGSAYEDFESIASPFPISENFNTGMDKRWLYLKNPIDGEYKISFSQKAGTFEEFEMVAYVTTLSGDEIIVNFQNPSTIQLRYDPSDKSNIKLKQEELRTDVQNFMNWNMYVCSKAVTFVGDAGLEPAASRPPAVRASHLRQSP